METNPAVRKYEYDKYLKDVFIHIFLLNHLQAMLKYIIMFHQKIIFIW